MALSHSERRHRDLLRKPVHCAFCGVALHLSHEHAERCPASPLTRPTPDRDDWREDAACSKGPSGLHPEAWYDEDADSNRAAIHICESCPVRQECLNDALTRHELWGIWGGLRAHERMALLGLPASHANKARGYVPRRIELRVGEEQA